MGEGEEEDDLPWDLPPLRNFGSQSAASSGATPGNSFLRLGVGDHPHRGSMSFDGFHLNSEAVDFNGSMPFMELTDSPAAMNQEIPRAIGGIGVNAIRREELDAGARGGRGSADASEGGNGSARVDASGRGDGGGRGSGSSRGGGSGAQIQVIYSIISI